MSKCGKVICDICGEHSKYSSPNDGTLKIKTKEWVECWEDSGWYRKTIHICNNCLSDLQRIVLRERKSHMDSLIKEWQNSSHLEVNEEN